MGTLLSQLYGKLGPKAENSMVSYWCPKMECYVYIGQMKQDSQEEEMKKVPEDGQA